MIPSTLRLAAAVASLAALLPGAAAANRWGAEYFPNVVLTTQQGKAVRFYDDLLKGKSVAINLIYTSCQDECPLETARLAQLQKILGDRVGRDLFIYSISIDPKHDTPEVLKAYAAKFGAGPGWLFLTGDENDIRLVTKKLGLSRESDWASKDGHASSLMVGNEPTGQWMRHSAVDNPGFLATSIGNFLGWRTRHAMRSYADARPIQADAGKILFDSRCSACHTVGAGDRIGPDLRGVTSRRDRAWLARYLLAPERVRAEGDAVANALLEKYRGVLMPNLGLGQADVNVLIGYLERQSVAPAR